MEPESFPKALIEHDFLILPHCKLVLTEDMVQELSLDSQRKLFQQKQDKCFDVMRKKMKTVYDSLDKSASQLSILSKLHTVFQPYLESVVALGNILNMANGYFQRKITIELLTKFKR